MTKNDEQNNPERLLSLIDAEDQRGIAAYLASGGSLKPALAYCLERRLYLRFLKKELPDTADIFENATIGEEVEIVPQAEVERIIALLRLGMELTEADTEALRYCVLLKINEGWAYFEYDEFIKARKAWNDALSLMEAAGFTGGTAGDSLRILFCSQPCKEGTN